MSLWLGVDCELVHLVELIFLCECDIAYVPPFYQIERLINSPEAHRNPPDFQDILQQVVRANERHKLCLIRKHLNQIAQEAFRETGTLMQDRRHMDLVYNFGSHLTDPYKPCKCDITE